MNDRVDRPAAAITAAMRRWVERTLAIKPGTAVFSAIGGGRSNLTYMVNAPGTDRAVLRRPPLGKLLPSAHDMLREQRILRALGSSPVPVPQIIACCERQDISEHPFYLMSYVDGYTIDSSAAAAKLDPAARAAVGPALASTLAALHAVDIDAVGLGDLGRRHGYAERQLRRWYRQWELTKLVELQPIDEAYLRLCEQLPPEPARPTLVHGDYNLANVIIGTGGDIRAVIDWELCTIGDPLADLGTLLTYWPDRPQQATLERDPLPLLVGFGRRRDLIAAYRLACPDVELDRLPYWLALAAWKLAIILQGVYRRWLDNPANGGRDAGQTEDAVVRLAGLALAAFDQRL